MVEKNQSTTSVASVQNRSLMEKVFLLCLCVLSLVVLLVFDPRMASKYIIFKWAMIQNGVFLLLCLSTFGKRKMHHIWLVAFMFFMMLALLSVLRTVDAWVSIFYVSNLAIGGIFIYLIATNITLPDARLILKICLLGGGILSVWAIVEFFYKNEIIVSLGNPNYVAQCLVPLVPISIYFIYESEKNFHRFVASGLTLLLCTVIILTQSRGGLIALIVGVLFFVSLIKSHKRTFAVASKLITGILLCLTVLILLYPNYREHLFNTWNLQNPSVQFRLLVWKDSINMMFDHFALGIGLGQFPYIYPFYRSKAERIISGQSSFVENAHNEYLSIGAELGVFGLLLLLGLGISLVIIGLRKYRMKQDMFYLSITASLAAVFVHAIFDFPIRNPVSYFITLILIGFILRGGKINDKPTPKQKIIFRFIAVSLLFFSLGMWVPIYRSDLAYSQSKKNLNNNKIHEALVWAQKANQICPMRTDLLEHVGFIAYKNNQYGLALDAWMHAFVKRPYSGYLLNSIALTYAKQGNYEQSLIEIQKAKRIDPFLINSWITESKIYASLNKLKKAVETLDDALVEFPQDDKLMIQKAVYLRKLDKKEQAIKIYEEVISKYPKNVLARVNYGSILAQVGEYKQANIHLQWVINKDPENILAMINLSNLAMAEGHMSQAQIYVNKALSINSEDINANLTYAVILERQSLFQDALKVYSKILKVYPKNALALEGVMRLKKELN